MKKIQLCFILVCLSGLSNLTAQTYNAQEVAKLKSFLSQTSAEAGKKNYEQLGITDLESVDWKKVPGLKWNENGRVEFLLWNEKNLAGDLDVSGFTDLLVMHCEENKLQSMNVTGNTKMIYNDCFKNELKTVDFSTNVNLSHLCCRYNQLTELDVTHNPKLSFLCSTGNRFEKIDLSKNPELVKFYAANGRLKSIDLSHNPKLKKVALRANQLSSLDVSNLTELESLTCFDNNLTSLNVSNCKSLEILSCYNNRITALDLSSCPKIKFLYVMKNKLDTFKLPAGLSGKLEIMCEKNRLGFSTLPNASLLHSYAPQETVSLSAPSDNVDLRNEYKVNGITSVFVWKEGNISVTPVSDKEGLFSFPDSYAGKVLICRVTNTGYPQLTMNYKVTLTAPTAVMPVESGVSVRVDGNQLYFSTDRSMTVRIYTLMGTIAREFALSEGETYVTLSSGIYILSFDNGEVRKVYVK